MTNTGTTSLYEYLIKEFEDISAVATDADTVVRARKRGFDHFRELGFPTRRVEDWKYTNVTPFLQEAYQIDGEITTAVSPALIDGARIPSLDCYEIVLINGQLSAVESLLPSYIRVVSLQEAQKESRFAEHFSSATNLKQDHFAALNTALFTNGLFIEVEAGAVADKPIHIIHVLSAESNLFLQPRHFFFVDKNASVSLIESHVSENGSSRIFDNSLTEIFIQESAKLNHYIIQTAGMGTRSVHYKEVSQRRFSLYNNFTFSLPSADLIRNNLHIALDDDQTETHLYGLYMGAGKQLIDNHTLVNHKKPYCNSNEIYKGVLKDQAVGVFNGKIMVEQEAQKTNAFQQNNNLLLSNNAVINSKPQLEIFADDVKCSHGSTTGQLNNESLFYLQTRGISKETARDLLVHAFAFDVTEKIGIPVLEKHINKLISQFLKLNNQ